MTTATIEAEVLELEKRFWQAIKDENIEEITSLTDDQSLVTGSQGIGLLDRKSMTEMMKSPGWKLDRFEIKDGAQVLQLQDDIVALGYEVMEELTVDGKPVKLEAADASVWIRRDGQWRCAVHTESLKGDPFGRDRKTRSPA